MNNLLLTLLLSSTIITYSQNFSNDELCNSWRKQMDQVKDFNTGILKCKEILPKVSDNCKTYVYLEIAGQNFRKLELDTTLFYYNKAIANAKSINDHEGLAYAYCSKISLLIRKEKHQQIRELLEKSRRLILPFPKSKSWIKYYEQSAYIAFVSADYYRAIDYMDSTIIAAEKSKYTTLIHETYEHLGYCYYRLGDYEKSADNFIKSLEHKERYGYQKDLGGTYRNLSNAYLELRYYDKAKYYIEKAIALTKNQGHELSLMSNYHKLAQCNRAIGLYIDAEKAIDSSMFLAKKVNDKSFITVNLREKGLLNFENYKNYNEAEEYFEKAYVSAQSSKDREHQFNTIKDLIELYFLKKDYKNIYLLIQDLDALNEIVNTPKYKSYLYEVYARYYERIGLFKSSLEKMKKYYELKDSINNKEVFEKVFLLEKQYDTKKKELTIANLNQEKQKQKQIAAKAEFRENLYLIAASILLLLLVISYWVFSKLRKQQKELTASNHVKNRLFSIIAHDLRGMIIPFQRSGKILKHHIDKGNYKRTIELSNELEKNSEGLSNMLDNLLNWSLEQMNGYKMNLESFLVEVELKEIISNFKQQASYKNTTIELQTKESLYISFDKGAFHVIFRNLIGNALKYTENGTIRIKCEKNFNTLLFSITDTGVGMSEDQLRHIFTLEERQTTVGTQGEKGTGLGLNLVYRFIKMHKGIIKVSSKKRIGTQFDISFPVTQFNTQKPVENQKALSA